MTPDIEEFDDASRYAWACGVFGLSPGSPPQEVRAAVVSLLDEAELVPTVAMRQALWLLCDPHSPQSWPDDGVDAFRDKLENNIAEEVGQFAAEFFAMPCGPRRGKWTRLLKQAEPFPRLRMRLASLQPGLDVERTELGATDTPDGILADRICRLFVQKPAAQEQYRRNLLDEMDGDWRAVVRRFRAKQSKLAALDPDFLVGLESARHGPDAAQQTAAIAAQSKLPANLIAEPKPTNAPTKSKTQTAGGGLRSTLSIGRYWYLFVIVAIGAMRALFNSSDSDSSHNNYNYSTPPNMPHSRELNELAKKLLQEWIDQRAPTSGGGAPWTPNESVPPGRQPRYNPNVDDIINAPTGPAPYTRPNPFFPNPNVPPGGPPRDSSP